MASYINELDISHFKTIVIVIVCDEVMWKQTYILVVKNCMFLYYIFGGQVESRIDEAHFLHHFFFLCSFFFWKNMKFSMLSFVHCLVLGIVVPVSYLKE